MKHHILTQTFFLLLLLFAIQPVTAVTVRPYLKYPTKKNYPCDICKISFDAKNKLACHKETHNKEKIFPCDFCNKSFSHKGTLTKHQHVKHIGQEIYKCEICGKNFINKSIFTMHKARHANDKPYKCKLCYQSFRCRGSLTRHISEYHSQNNNSITPSTSIIQPTTFYRPLTINYPIIVPTKKPLLMNIAQQVKPLKPLYEFNAAATDPNLLEWIDKL